MTQLAQVARSQELLDLAASLTLTDPDLADHWDWAAEDDDETYIDCSRHAPGIYQLEVGAGHAAVQVELGLADLREIHRRLTVALIAAQMRQAGER